MRVNNLPLIILTACILTAGCSGVEDINKEESLLIANAPKTSPIEKSFKSSPLRNIKTQTSRITKIKKPPAEALPALDSFIGLTPPEIQTFLGSPQFQRIDTPAEIWQYRLNGCVLYLFLYPSSDGLAVSHLETRSHLDSNNNRQKCFTDIVRANRKKPD